MLETRNLEVKYPGQKKAVFSNLSLNVKDGEILLLKGPNGCGKSTLLYALANIIPQEITSDRQGEILINGALTNDARINQMTPTESISLANPRWELILGNPMEELVFPLENLGLPVYEIQARLDQVIQQFQLQKILDRDAHKLSLGWQKLLSLAVQAVIQPRVLLLDEPLNGLSEDNKSRVLIWLKDYMQIGGCLIVAEHDEAILILNPRILEMG